jgi:NADH:ubiquinone oxidoreductase subunit E
VGACGLAPVVMVNDKVYGRVKAEHVKGIVEDFLPKISVG